jgi:hypothetical protein
MRPDKKGELQPDTDSPPLVEIACNLASASESDLRPQVEDGAMLAADPFGITGHPLWFYAVLLAAVLSAVEWGLYQRRWIS